MTSREMTSSGISFAGGRDADGSMQDAARVGAELRAARLQLGYALPDVVAVLRIRLHFLEAIEDGRVADLPVAVYAVGFVRNYAASLGLDAADVARRFRAEAYPANRKTELAFPAPVPERGVPAGAAALLGMLLMAGAYVGWYRISGDRQVSAEFVPAVPERLAALADRDTQPSSPSPQVGAVVPGPSIAQPQPAASPPPMPSTLVAPDTPAVVAANDSRILLRVKADSWIQVRERQGPVLLSRIMRAGDVWPVPNGTQLLLSTGNAGGTELLVDGEATPALGVAGAVRRDVPLDADVLKAISTGRAPTQ